MSDQEQQPQDENQIIAERRAKLKALRELGNPFPNDFPREHLAEVLHEQYEDLPKEELEAKNIAVVACGIPPCAPTRVDAIQQSPAET